MLNHQIWLTIILACLAGVAKADDWDDFANNLFTDLAPLLALFGERATMQFMSQALGWEDCVILAMAPLGIITILVSAIRVGGPGWLKAIIGRARENMAAAELELMSSTSNEVSELYNGETIVRCQGRGPVWEFIYLIPITPRTQDPDRRPEIKVLSLEEACKPDKKLLQKVDNGLPKAKDESMAPPVSWILGIDKIEWIFNKVIARSSTPTNNDVSVERGVGPVALSERPADGSDQSPDETIYVIRNIDTGAPNITLNLQDNDSNRNELKVYAIIGIFLQLCILVFFGVIAYYPAIENSFRKDDRPVDHYAFPLAVGGTLILIIGMFICGTVVENSTEETRYKKDDKYEMRVAWIQQKHTVGDQVFDPFATFPDYPRDIITMSQRCDKGLEKLTVIGIFIGLAGFIVQFIGLRGMNSAATLAQLGATGIMAAIRALRLAKQWTRASSIFGEQQATNEGRGAVHEY
ncbi:hypothetical protein LRP88_09330 [Fusarium phalaenopsidis]